MESYLEYDQTMDRSEMKREIPYFIEKIWFPGFNFFCYFVTGVVSMVFVMRVFIGLVKFYDEYLRLSNLNRSREYLRG